MTGRHQSATRRPATSSIGMVLLWLCIAATVLSAAMAATGGFTLDIFGLSLSMHAVSRPVVVAVALGLAALFALGSDGTRDEFSRLHAIVSRRGLAFAIALAAFITAGTWFEGAHIAGGADSSGYLSEARLWRAAGFRQIDRLRTTTPLADELTLTNKQYPFTPLGFQPSGEPATIVPVYPPGLPLHYAAAAAMAGERAKFLVVPLAAGALVIAVFVLGRRIGGPDTALIAAALAGSSPMVLYQATQPMSDVPAACWWTVVVLLLTFDSAMAALFAGLAAVIACAVRPNLFAMVPAIVLLAAWWKPRRVQTIAALAAFVAPVAIAAIAFAWFQRELYGSASKTGYGEVSSLFSLTHVWPNLGRYPRWAIFTQSALILAALAAPLLIRRGSASPSIDRLRAERIAWSGLLFFVCLQAFYLLYIAFDEWVYFRFLLPALPWVLVLEAVAIAAICNRAPLRYRGLAVLLTAVLVTSWGVGRARSLGAFRLQDSERRYVDAAGFVRGLPPNAVMLSMQHSGSLAYYNAAPILRWDWIEPGEIDRAIDQLSRNGRAVFAVLDDWEEPRFRQRFTNTRVAGQLAAPLYSAGGPPAIRTRVFAISGTKEFAAAPPVSSQPPPALRSPHTPAAPGRARGSANANR